MCCLLFAVCHNGHDKGPSHTWQQVFCNPNAYDTHINAKLLITMRHAGVSFTTETKLHAVKADVDAYLS